jgi:6,7-dimethyl-8-ribityllumazine synthase
MQSQALDSDLPRPRVAFVQSYWHKEIVDRCRDAFVGEMIECGFAQIDIDLFEVTGAFEIPLQAKLLAKSGEYAAVVAAGFVIDGGIYRHEFVAQAVITALMQIQLDTEVPIISAVLTPQHFHSHADHHSFFLNHFVEKGREAAHACKQTIRQLQLLRNRSNQSSAYVIV